MSSQRRRLYATPPPERRPVATGAIELARECGYLPLALALNGAMLASGTPWEDLLAALRSAELDFAEQRFANYPYPNVLRSIKASVDALAAADSQALARYSELAAFNWLVGVPELAGGSEDPPLRNVWSGQVF